MNMFHIQMLNFLFFFLAHFQMFSPATAGQGASIAMSPAPFTRAQEAEAALDAIDPDVQDLICDSTCHKGKETYSNDPFVRLCRKNRLQYQQIQRII